MTPAARIAAAIELLDSINKAPRKPADAVANDYFRNRRFIGSGDRRSVSDRVWRVLRSQRRLTWWLARGRMAPTARMLVASSLLTEGWTLDGVGQSFSGGQFGPDTLDQVEKSALRNIEGHGDEHPDMPEAVRLEMPDWILLRLQERFGDMLATEMAAMNAPATLDLRVNLLKGTREEALAALATEGLECQPTPLSPWGLRIEERRSVTSGPAFQTGLVEIQDEGSQLVAALVDARPEMRVVDYCAGAGGKTLAMAMTMQNRGHIVACDVSAPRLDGAVRRLRRAGVHNVEQHLIVSGDKWAKRRAGSFDRVLVDAPCTGTGTWRRNPDARQRLVERDLLELVPKQAMILDAAAGLVRIGGRLIYATCSLLPEENESQVSAFLSRHPDFVVRPLMHAWRLDTDLPAAENFPAGEFLSLTPLRHGTDGFFGAVLERTAAKSSTEPSP
jgi:16S rRNA (cytosine967-C5)-methyltransferase